MLNQIIEKLKKFIGEESQPFIEEPLLESPKIIPIILPIVEPICKKVDFEKIIEGPKFEIEIPEKVEVRPKIPPLLKKEMEKPKITPEETLVIQNDFVFDLNSYNNIPTE